MSRESELLRAIIDDPDDDGLRLVYADALEESGDPKLSARAEFIRIQCRIANATESTPVAAKVLRRERTLLKRYAKQWARPFKALIQGWMFHRGLLEGVKVNTGKYMEFEAPFRDLVESTPLRALHFTEQFGEPECVLPAAPLMSRIRELGVRGGFLHETGPVFRELLESGHLSQLDVLHLECARSHSWFRPRTLAAILKSSAISNITSLIVSDHLVEVHPIVMSAVAKSESLSRLRRLGLLGRFDRRRMRSFTRAPFADSLEVLELQHCYLDDGAWNELLSDRAFPNLDRLYLAGARLGTVSISVPGPNSDYVREQARERFGQDALNLDDEFLFREHYHTWQHIFY